MLSWQQSSTHDRSTRSKAGFLGAFWPGDKAKLVRAEPFAGGEVPVEFDPIDRFLLLVRARILDTPTLSGSDHFHNVFVLKISHAAPRKRLEDSVYRCRQLAVHEVWLAGTKGRLEVWNAVNAIVRKPIDYA
jgi:hypothetical protein